MRLCMILKALLSVMLGAVVTLALFALAACSVGEEVPENDAEYCVVTTDVATLPAIRLAILPSDDLLPLWVAESMGFLAQGGLEVEIVSFASAEEQQIALVAGEVDGAVLDMMTLARLSASGSAGGSASGTALRAVTTVQSFPAEIVSDDGTVDRQTPEDFEDFALVLAVSEDFLLGNLASGETSNSEAAAKAIVNMLSAWDRAVTTINQDPNTFRSLLIEKAHLSEHLAGDYSVGTYDSHALPPHEQWEAVLSWMYANNYLQNEVSIEGLVFDFEPAP